MFDYRVKWSELYAGLSKHRERYCAKFMSIRTWILFRVRLNAVNAFDPGLNQQNCASRADRFSVDIDCPSAGAGSGTE